MVREGWRRNDPRTDLVTDELLDELVAAGTVSDAARAFDRLEAAGLDVAVVRDDPAVDPAETLRQAHSIVQTRR